MEVSKPAPLASLDSVLEAIDYRVARTSQELEAAYGLVYQEYLKRRYINESSSRIKCSVFNLVPEAATFVAVLDKTVLATASIIPDSPLGLPLDSIYAQETTELFRTKGKKICEISMLASDTTLFSNEVSLMLNSKKMFLVFYLFKAVFDYGTRVLGVDNICITINPKHALIYDFLMFRDFGRLKTYDSVNGAPAIAKYLNVREVERECELKEKEGLLKMFFQRKTDPEKLSGKVSFTPEQIRYFFAEKTDVLARATPAQKQYLKSIYPRYDF
jgi:hypothetical protein